MSSVHVILPRDPARRILPAICLLASSVALLLLTGCGMGVAANSNSQQLGSMQGPALNGKALGGLQAIAGGVVQLYQVGTGAVAGSAGYSANAISLLTTTVTTSDGKGIAATGNTGNANNTLSSDSFITGGYSCAAGSQVYITIAGGSPDNVATDTNPNIALVAAPGSCSTLLANASTAFIFVNEVSTVAAAYALAQFATTTSFTALSAQPGTVSTPPADNIATSSSNTQGLVNAMATAVPSIFLCTKDAGLRHHAESAVLDLREESLS